MFRVCDIKGRLFAFILILLLTPALLYAQVPTEAEIHNRLGNEYCDRGEFKKGVKEYEEAVKIYPEYIDAYYNLGVTYFHDLKDYQKAAEYFQGFLNLEKTSQDAQQVRKWLDEIEKEHGIKPGPASGQEVAAIPLEPPPAPVEPPVEPLSVPVAVEPPPVVSPLPPLPPKQEKQTAEEAQPQEENFRKALVYKNQGNLYSKEGKYQLAVNEYLKAIELRPDYTDALYNLSKTYDFDLNDDEKAIKYYEEFLKYEVAESGDAKEVRTWLLKAKMDLAKAKEAPVPQVAAKEVAPPPVVVTETKPIAPAVGARYDDRPFTKGLVEAPAQVAAVPQPPAPAPAQPPKAAVQLPPAPVPVMAPAAPPLAPAVDSIMLKSIMPNQQRSVQTSIYIKAELRNELLGIFKEKNAPDADKLAQLFLTKMRQESMPNGDEVIDITIPGTLLANLPKVNVISHNDRIVLNNEKGNLLRSPQTPQTKGRLQEINRIMEDGYEIKP